jgi:type I restriction enzyme, S subunit
MSHRRYPARSLGDFIDGFDAGVSVNSANRPSGPGEHGVLKVSAVSVGRFVPGENKVILARELPRMGPSVRAGDLLVTRANTKDLIGAAALVPEDFPWLHLSDKTWRARLRSSETATRRWLAHVLNSPSVRGELRRRASGTSGSMKNISQAAYLRIRVATPPEDVRGSLADVLDAATRQEGTMLELVDAKRRRKAGLIQHLLTARIRFPGSDVREWNLMRLGDVVTESRDIASTGTHARKLTVRLYGRGVVSKRDARPGSENTQYYRRRAGQLIYSKLDFLNGAFGIVPPELDGYESTLDLPAFDVSPKMNIRWLLHLLSWPDFYRSQLHLANGGRKARRVNPAELLEQVVSVPGRTEQDAIVELVDGLDREIALLEQLLKAVERRKRVLLDKLLSGELRLPAK